MTAPVVAVAIPALNEAERIGRCLDALEAQECAGAFAVVVVANDCTDDTAVIARRARPFPVHVVEHRFPPDERGAGAARRMAMAHAAAHGAIVLTTDADCVADRDWIAGHRAAFARGVDAVAGRVSADWSELSQQPAEALRIGALETDYLALVATAEGIFDPQPHDPLPRHMQQCGANIGITRTMLERIGGVPPLVTSEDRALLSAVDRAGGRIRHDPAPHVVASARLVGRADGGMADTLRERMRGGGYRCDEQLWRADALVAMWRARRAACAALRDPTPAALGSLRAAIEAQHHPRDRLTPADIPAQIARMQHWIATHD